MDLVDISIMCSVLKKLWGGDHKIFKAKKCGKVLRVQQCFEGVKAEYGEELPLSLLMCVRVG